MYVPRGLRNRADAPGSLFVGGCVAVSLVLSALAFGWVGLVAGGFVVLLLFCGELWREAASLEKSCVSMEGDLLQARTEAQRVPELVEQREFLETQVEALQEEQRRPNLRIAEILEGLASHASFVDLTQKHRDMRRRIPDAPVTRIQVDEDLDTVTVTGMFSGGADAVIGEYLGLVDTDDDTILGPGMVVSTDGQQAFATMDFESVSPSMAEELVERRSYNPQGYVLRLAGLCFVDYGDLSDDGLEEIKSALVEASTVLTNTLVPPAGATDEGRLADLEAESVWTGFDEANGNVEEKGRDD